MRVMLFKGNSSRLELLIEKIQANKENQELGDQHIQDALGTEAGSSWGSEGQTSPPSSCATPNSATDVPDAELTFTLGVTEGTPYPCAFCDKAFPRLSYLKKHEQSHTEHMPFRCDYCNRLFKHKRSRDRHIKLHTGDKKYRCSQCDAAFSRSDHLKIHMRTHDNLKPFQCTVCNRGYNTAAALTSHMQTHKKASDTPSPTPAAPGTTFKCLQCSEIFRKPEDLQSHMASQHNVEARATPPVVPSPRRLRLSPHDSGISCVFCTRESFTSLEALQLHMQTMHGTIFNGERQRDVPQERPLFPSQASPSPSLLPSHRHPMLTPPSPSLPYSCDLCTMRFHSVPALQKHTFTVHGFHAKETGSLLCVQCNLQFSSPALFAEHYVLLHGTSMGVFGRSAADQMKPTDLSLTKKSNARTSDERPSKKARHSENGISSSSNGVEIARRTPTMNHHHYENPGTLLCNQCDAALPNFEAFRSHVKSHIDEAGGLRGLLGGGTEPRKTPPVICPHCGVQLNSPAELPRHITSHFLSSTSEFTCQSCLKVFKHSDDLQKHQLEVHAQHLFRCAICKEMFDSKQAIQVHFSVNHSSESKQYRCIACPTLAVYHSEMDFSIHVRTMHTPQLLATAKPPVIQPAQLFRCLFCRLSFPTELEMQLHLAVHTKQFHCHLCPESFHIEFLLDRHMQTHHSSQILNGGDEMESSHSKPKGGNKSSSNHSSTSSTSRTNGNIESNKKQDSANNNIVGTCEICERGDFASEAELAAHRKLVHHIKNSSSGKLSLHCAYCNESCKSRSDLENHMKSHSQGCVTQGKHKCNICDEMCSSAAILAEHKLTHCKVINGTSCTQCKASITNEDQFYQHLRQHSNTSPPDSGSPTNQLVLPTACVICRQTLVSDMEARIHARFHLNQSDTSQCSVCLHASDRRELIGGICKECHQRHGKASPTRCTECQLKFETGSALEAHMATVHRKTYQCIKCQVSFESEKEIQLHVATHLMSEGNSGLECRLCMRVLGSPLQLQTHLIEHTFAGCPTFTCYICSAVFTAAHGLQAHMLDHGLAARPYDCPHCSQRFFFRAELDNHSFSHMEEDSSEDRAKVPPYYPYHTKMESVNSSPMSTTSGMEMTSSDSKSKPTKSTGREELDNTAMLQFHTQQQHGAKEDLDHSEEKVIKKEIKQETLEEGEEGEEEDEEQIDVGDHHSEEPVRSSEDSPSMESVHPATLDLATDSSLRL
ncbi:zinc finger protein 423 isoform X2 [Homalodisca vitripennis]|uniref:zinc finger protein 423 isoform X2 n=1 Tax=Homalodisca vitripennis TaxID=197043 RepID=UPI001EEA953F|nr:zinc finger protein 423 isoform X2 [Homalodisca vitripennis]